MNNLANSYQQGDPSGTGMPAPIYENNVGGQWPTEFPPGSIPEYMDEITSYNNIDDILEELSAPSGEPSAAATDLPSGSNNSTRPRPSTATKKKKGGNRKPRRIYTEEEIRQRRAERQKHYRERQQQAEVQVQKDISATAAEIEAAHKEQDSLLMQHNVLSKVTEYATASVNAAQSVVSNAVNRVRSEYNNAVEGLAWLGLQVYNPSDAQIHAYIDKRGFTELHTMSGNITERCSNLFARWLAEPESRENIEAQIERIRSIRIRALQYMVRTRPGLVIELVRQRMIPTGPDGVPNPKLVEIVAKLELTPEQLESFEREWNLYLQRTESIRQEARSVISFLSSFSTEDAASFCCIGAASMFLDRLQAVQELEAHPAREAHALVNFSLWVPANLTMQQKATLVGGCAPYYPDFIQIGRILFGDRNEDDITEL